MAELQIEGASKRYGSHPVLTDVSLGVRSGALVALLGASGSGKTTLLRLICGFERLDGGSIRLDGRLLAGPGIHVAAERRRIGYVAQEGALFPHLDVAANAGFGLPRGERRCGATIDRLLAIVGLPASYGIRMPHELSGGEQQRVALARALAPRPRIVLLDEPFSSLDAALRCETRTVVADALAQSGATALLVTHDQAEALSMGSQVAVLRHGSMAQVDTPGRLYRCPADADLARFLGEAVLLPGAARGATVTCALGVLRLAPGMPEAGDVDVMIRPEQIRLTSSATDAIAARVTRVTFYGPDATVALQLADVANIAVTARVAGYRVPRPGDLVGVAVDGDVVAYGPRADETKRSEPMRLGRAVQEEEPVATG